MATETAGPHTLPALRLDRGTVRLLNADTEIGTLSGFSVTQAHELIHRSNAYPHLLAVVYRLRAALRANGAPNCEAMKESTTLLLELGEEAS